MEATTEAVRVASRPEFDEYVAARSRALLRTAYLLTQDSQLAEDLLQTALTKCWFAWGRIDGDPTAYVRRVMVNSYVNDRRRRWHGELPTERLPEAATREALDTTDLREALRHLPHGQRAVVVLRYYEDLTETETARVLGCSVGTVKSQASKALARLRVDPSLEAPR